MEQVTTTYREEEQAWVSPELSLERDIYMTVVLKQKGKIVIRQETANGKHPRVPIKRHKDTDSFSFRISVPPQSVKLQIFTSTEPKEIKYAYI